MSSKPSIKISRVRDLLKKLFWGQRKYCIMTPILWYMHVMEHLLVQFFVRNSNLARSALSNLCWGCEKPIFLTSIALLVVTACVLGGDSLWLEYYCFIPVRQTCFIILYLSEYYWNFRKMSRSAPLKPEPGPSRIQDTGQGQDRVSVIRKVTKAKDNDGNTYEANVTRE